MRSPSHNDESKYYSIHHMWQMSSYNELAHDVMKRNCRPRTAKNDTAICDKELYINTTTDNLPTTTSHHTYVVNYWSREEEKISIRST